MSTDGSGLRAARSARGASAQLRDKRSKIVDEQEVLRWFAEGRTYRWMCEEYIRKYNIKTTPSMWGNFRRKHGLPNRIVPRDGELIPWSPIQRRHRWGHAIEMLRAEKRRRAGEELLPDVQQELDNFKALRAEEDSVIHYQPDTKQGWFPMPRRPGIDFDLIREPDKIAIQRGWTPE